MANLIRRREPETSATPWAGWDPFRMMRSMLRWDPFRELERELPTGEAGYLPDFDVKETKDSYVFKADLPGIREEDLEISVTGNRLTVSGKREVEHRHEDERYYAVERSFGSFSRSFTLPDGVNLEGVNADLRDGVLTLSVPKKPEVQARRIALKGKEKEKAKA